MKEGIKNILITVAVILAIVVGTYTAIRWDAIVSKWEVNAQREVFKESSTYNEAAASFLADSYKQYNDAESEAERNAIMEYVVMRYPNLDYSNIDNQTLKQFYKDCINR
ncbi:MAG: hypothetical protein NC548_13195 [Lachnospiraceae bacterium]|nr:hypothetical protein [Lachnospiraceae bacterium]MCM1230654.1 hypothetical protein [Ruminococcus flavefaciens]MCM1439990.1 hypothetical protein [Roseburia sp.]